MPRNYDHITSDVPWERNQESPEAWAAFVQYRDAGAERSVRSVARALDKSATLIAKWSVKHHWVDRVAAWDAHCDEQNRKAMDKARAKMAADQAKAGRATWEKALEEILKRAPSDARWQDLVALLAQGVKIERLALGESTEATRAEVSGPNGSPVKVVTTWAEAALAAAEGAKEPENDDGEQG